ncbi:hypothetical protein CYMTET_28503 [Cymbomonas tetramitiformis]|uniref:Right handed beta helix domain-containing protein n=1 Tax=Cymbomonas tetramitiformis TaxID=36881 RepID=A0AAE0FN10_9CHLO|nr:hypothetical protein CYMTET_28503 [Cymbomonas tetramitiformis]
MVQWQAVRKVPALLQFFQILSFHSEVSFIQTTGTNEIQGITIWQQDQSPVTISESLHVTLEGTLVIQAGVTVQFTTSAAYLLVDGTLNIMGTATQPVTLQSMDQSTAGAWAGIIFRGSFLNMVHARVMHAAGGVDMRDMTNTSAFVYFQDTLFDRNTFAVRAPGITLHNTVFVLTCEFTNNGQGLVGNIKDISLAPHSTIIIQEAVFSDNLKAIGPHADNDDGSIWGWSGPALGPLHISASFFTRNAIAIEGKYQHERILNISNCSFVSNTQAIYNHYGSKWVTSVTDCLFQHNVEAVYGHVGGDRSDWRIEDCSFDTNGYAIFWQTGDGGVGNAHLTVDRVLITNCYDSDHSALYAVPRLLLQNSDITGNIGVGVEHNIGDRVTRTGVPLLQIYSSNVINNIGGGIKSVGGGMTRWNNIIGNGGYAAEITSNEEGPWNATYTYWGSDDYATIASSMRAFSMAPLDLEIIYFSPYLSAELLHENPLDAIVIHADQNDANATTNTIQGITIWQQDQSPVTISESLHVTLEGTLVIQAGVTVQFTTSAAYLLVDGTLNIMGTATQPVTLQSMDQSTAGAWAGIIFRGSFLNMVHARVMHAAGGVDMRDMTNTSAFVYFQDTLFDRNTFAVRAPGITLHNTVFVLTCEFTNNGQGLVGNIKDISLAPHSTIIIQEAVFSDNLKAIGPHADNDDGSIWGWSGPALGPLHISASFFTRNAIAIEGKYQHERILNISNCSFVSNTQAIYNHYGSKWVTSVTDCLFQHNVEAVYGHVGGDRSDWRIEDCSFDTNGYAIFWQTGDGGVGNAHLTVDRVLITNCYDSDHSALYAVPRLLLQNSDITGNIGVGVEHNIGDRVTRTGVPLLQIYSSNVINNIGGGIKSVGGGMTRWNNIIGNGGYAAEITSNEEGPWNATYTYWGSDDYATIASSMRAFSMAPLDLEIIYFSPYLSAELLHENPLDAIVIHADQNDANATTNTIQGITIWQQDQSPVTISESLHVTLEGTLVIQAGVTVQFTTSAAYLLVDGTLNIMGTATQPVTLQSMDQSTAGAWAGIIFRGSFLNMVHARVMHAAGGVDMRDMTNTSAFVYFQDTLFDRNTFAVRAPGITLHNTVFVLTCEFTNNGQGLVGNIKDISLAPHSTIIIQEAVFSDNLKAIGPHADNDDGSIWGWSGPALGPLHISASFFTRNAIAIEGKYQHERILNISNCSFVSNTQAIYNHYGSKWVTSVTDCLFQHNVEAVYGHVGGDRSDWRIEDCSFDTNGYAIFWQTGDGGVGNAHLTGDKNWSPVASDL